MPLAAEDDPYNAHLARLFVPNATHSMSERKPSVTLFISVSQGNLCVRVIVSFYSTFAYARPSNAQHSYTMAARDLSREARGRSPRDESARDRHGITIL